MKHFVTSDGLRLAWSDDGRGPPVLCLAGLSRNGQDFQPVVDRFGDRARILRLDMRGRGGSDNDPDHTNYNVMVEARDVVEFLDHAGLPRVAIIGTSRGGLIAMMLAAGMHDRLSGVALVDIGPVVDPRGLERIMGYLGIVPDCATLDEFAHQTAIAMAGMFPGVSDAQWRTYLGAICHEGPDGLELNYDAKLRDAMLEQATDGTLPELWQLYDAMQDLPLALLWGENSDVLNAKTVAGMRARRPDMIFAPVPDRGHVPFLNEPQSLAGISDFLDRIGA